MRVRAGELMLEPFLLRFFSGAVYSQLFGGEPYDLDISAVVSNSLPCLATKKKHQNAENPALFVFSGRARLAE